MSDEVTYRWAVQLEGHSFDLDRLSAFLQSEGYVLHQHNNNEWYLGGPSIEKAADARDACRRAAGIVGNINAVLC